MVNADDAEVLRRTANVPGVAKTFSVVRNDTDAWYDVSKRVLMLAGAPLLVIPIFSPDGSYTASFLGNYATINVTDALARVPGVGQVKLFGTSDYSMRIWVRPDTLAKLQLTVTDLLTAIVGDPKDHASSNLAKRLAGEA